MSAPREVLGEHGKALLREYKELVQQLVNSLLTASPAFVHSDVKKSEETPEAVMHKIIYLDEQLQNLAQNVVKHQKKCKIINQLSARIRSQELVIMKLSTKLKMAENALEQILDEAKKNLAVQELASKNTVDPDEMVAYAGLISYNVAPPANWSDGLPLGSFRTGYPYPMEDVRRSKWFMTHHGLTESLETTTEEPVVAQPAVGIAMGAVEKAVEQMPPVDVPDVVEVVDLDFDFGSDDDGSE
eukprot:CFRG1037T1